MDSPYKRELQVAIRAAEQAARVSQAVLPDTDKGAVEKEDNLGPVTIGDFAIQALLTASLHAAFPNDIFVGEEDASALRADPVLCERVWTTLQRTVDTSVAPSTGAQCVLPTNQADLCDTIDQCQNAPGPGRVWVFDPIDGTKTFLRREMYAINVALLVDGQQTVAVVGCPLLSPDAETGDTAATATIQNDSIDPSGRGSLFFAVKGHGAYVRPLFEESRQNRGSDLTVAATAVPRRLPRYAASSPSSQTVLRPVTCYFLQESALDDVHRAVADRLGVPFPGSDLLGWVPRWSALATGRANMTVWVYRRRDRHAKIWDHAGAMLLFEEVGGKITDVDGKPLDLLAGRILVNNFGFVAAPADAHEAVLKAVHAVLRDQGRTDLLSAN
ncbi:3'(2'),5'-bisphosphate nucleotidase [Sporothrix schenckii ATCC 58251]|uniref:3'(2'),5'-bisphosphate nucleotidase n=1 Tax=Sporothrix schenckii (strain ATCC 58251 / de Perez 2211183) TaxID=1391915 RepID=U7Q1Y3_SPOS1|nr:3'(2'),5'-bisphosphate nucleotidase [Sporothrix schenckii ATCC 58251]